MPNSRLIVFGGPILTQDPAVPEASSLVCARERVLEVRPPGAPRPEAHPGDRLLDLKGQTLLPGFIDAHTHLIHWGLLRVRPYLADTRSPEEALERVAARHATLPPGVALIAEGWDESLWARPRFPHRDELDRISTSRPLILRRVCGHMAVANGAALACLPDDPQVHRDSGLLLEEASMGLARVFPPTPAELDEGLQAAIASYHELGVTAVHDMSTPAQLQTFARAEAAGRLPLTIHAILTRPHLQILADAGLGVGWQRGRVRTWGVKFFSDGSLGARTAALSADYADAPGERGQLLLSVEELAAAARLGEAHGIPLAVHAIGDRAVETVLRAFEAALPAGGSRLGHRIEHLEMVDEAQLDRMRALGLVASMQPNFVSSWGLPGQMYEARLGLARAAAMNPMRRVLAAGIPLAFGSDAMPAGVLPGLAAAVHAPHPGQRLTPDEAFAAATRGAALAAGDGEGGLLTPGSRADLVVLSGDLSDPAGCRVTRTLVGGRVVHAVDEAGANPVSR